MINKTKLKVQSKAAFKIAKSLFDGIGEKYKKNASEVKEDIERKIEKMEAKLKENDEKIAKRQEDSRICEMRINQESYITEKQRKIAEEEMRKLKELEAVENGYRRKHKKIEDEVYKMRKEQTKLQSEYLRAKEELAEMELSMRQEEEIKLLEAPADVKAEMEKNQKVVFQELHPEWGEAERDTNGMLSFLGSKKKTQQMKEKTKRIQDTVRKFNVYDQEELARNIRYKLHILMHEFKDSEEVKAIIQKSDTTIQYCFKDYIYAKSIGSNEYQEILQGIYYFKTSSNPNEKMVTMHKEEIGNDKTLIRYVGSGEEEFKIDDNSLDKDEIQKIAKTALKYLCSLENSLVEKREEQAIVIEMQEDEIKKQSAL